MKEKFENTTTDILHPQELMDRVLSKEIEIAEKIADARKNADKEIRAMQSKLNSTRSGIIDEAREERDKMLKDGIEKAREKAVKLTDAAREEAKLFFERGKAFLPEAENHALALLLTSGKDPNDS